jgi:hypothetical protein
MKKVLRSCFDPLPRFLSMKSILGLVAMVLLGTGISVYEYLESARPLQRSSQQFTAPAVITTERSTPEVRESRAPLSRSDSPRPVPAAAEVQVRGGVSSDSTACPEPQTRPPASIWEPTIGQADS